MQECRLPSLVKPVVIWLLFVAATPNSLAQSTIHQRITAEATLPNNQAYHPLPLIASWNTSTWWNYDPQIAGLEPGYSPLWQLDMIDQGNYFLPWLKLPDPIDSCPPGQPCVNFADYLAPPLRRAASHNLPISFISTQWERLLSEDPSYLQLPEIDNPNAIGNDGELLLNSSGDPQIAPFGSLEPWYQVGKKWASSSYMRQAQSWYPDPPKVLFISNNEHAKIWWHQLDQEKRFVDLYGTNTDDTFKRQIMAQGWEVRYKELFRGFRDGLVNQSWKDNSVFIGYNAFGPHFFGRWSGWHTYANYIPGQIDAHPNYWEGGTPELYLWPNRRDNQVVGPLVGSMNWLFMQQEAWGINPDFWFETSVWSGNQTTLDDYTNANQTLTPGRYQGFVTYNMWLTRPRVVREYRDYSETRETMLPWLEPLIDSVNLIHTHPTLTSFWRDSQLVVNVEATHPYQSNIPADYAEIKRWYHLTTNLDPAMPWTATTDFPVITLARVQHSSPNRQWLVYAYAPMGDQVDVTVSIPDYQDIILDINLNGSYFLVNEAENAITPILYPTPSPTATACKRADISQDGIVDLTDYSILALNFLATSPTNTRVDINQDGIVDLTDYSLLANQFLRLCN